MDVGRGGTLVESMPFESRSSHHVRTLGKSFTYSDTVSIAVVGSASERLML